MERSKLAELLKNHLSFDVLDGDPRLFPMTTVVRQWYIVANHEKPSDCPLLGRLGGVSIEIIQIPPNSNAIDFYNIAIPSE